MPKGLGFNTGSDWLDRYYEAWYEIIDKYYKKLAPNSNYYKSNYRSIVRDAVKTVNAEAKRTGFDFYSRLDDYYKNYYSDWDWFGSARAYLGLGINVAKIARKWGFQISKQSKISRSAYTKIVSSAGSKGFEGDVLINPSGLVSESTKASNEASIYADNASCEQSRDALGSLVLMAALVGDGSSPGWLMACQGFDSTSNAAV
jgi:hypothetical protein